MSTSEGKDVSAGGSGGGASGYVQGGSGLSSSATAATSGSTSVAFRQLMDHGLGTSINSGGGSIKEDRAASDLGGKASKSPRPMGNDSSIQPPNKKGWLVTAYRLELNQLSIVFHTH